MPHYAASCDNENCGVITDYFSCIDERNNCTEKCPECGGSMSRDIAAELAGMGHFNATCKSNPRWSWSMGVPACQVNQFRKRFPNSTYSDDGRLLIKSRQDKLRQAKERGFVELN